MDPLNQSLLEAAKDGDREKVARLLKLRADVNAADQHGCTALMWAAFYDRVEVVNLLLEADADVNATDNDGVTPLITAAHWGYVEVVEALLKKDVDVNWRDNTGHSALYYARIRRNESIVALIDHHLSHMSGESLDDAEASSSVSSPRP